MSEVSIKFSCECGKAYKVSDKFAGKRVKCKQCGETVIVPSSSSEDIPSIRASAITQSSLLKTGEMKVPDEPAEDEPAPPPKKSARAPSAKEGKEGKESKKRGGGGDTEVFEAPDITAALQTFHRKREDQSNRHGEGRIVLFEDRKPTKTFRIDKNTKLIGRDPKCEVHIEHPTVSKEHVRIEYTMGMFIATDASSRNGMVVNGKKVRRASLKDNDILQLGDIILRVDCSK